MEVKPIFYTRDNSHLEHHRPHCDVGQPLPQIPLDAYHLCVFDRHRNIEVAYTSISLVYGTRE